MTEAQDRYGSGRYIDRNVGLLTGEASQQDVKQERERRIAEIAEQAWTSAPSSMQAIRDGTPTYYDRPAVKEPVWKWYIAAYFYAGGVAGAASAIGAAAQAADGRALRGLITRCRRLSVAGLGIGTFFLIIDLGRPARFANMLRVFRPTSPMNVGSWLLSAAAPLAGASLVLDGEAGRRARLGDAAGYAAGLLAPGVSTYTAALLSHTSIPIWIETRRTLPMLFGASSLAGAASLLELMRLTPEEERIVGRLAKVGKLAELISTSAVQRDASRVERVGRPLREGLSGALWRTAKACSAASLLVSLLPVKSRRVRVVAGLLGTAGALATRFAIWQAGYPSARDPRATFEVQRAGRGGAEATGTAAVTGPDAERAVEPIGLKLR